MSELREKLRAMTCFSAPDASNRHLIDLTGPEYDTLLRALDVLNVVKVYEGNWGWWLEQLGDSDLNKMGEPTDEIEEMVDALRSALKKGSNGE